MNFNKAREAIKYLIMEYGIEQMYIPYYLCDVVRHTLVENKCKPIFYHIDEKFYPMGNFETDTYFLYPNYFGICSKNVLELASRFPYLIVDNAHAYYEEPSGFASFYCNYKFGYEGAELVLKNDCRKNCVRTDLIQRKEIFYKLHEKYSNDNQLEIDIASNPFVYPFLAPSIEFADNIVRRLISEGKTIYRYWNQIPKTYPEYMFYSRLVPIPLV